MRDRADYAFPFAIAAESRQAQRVRYERHVADMVRQVLLTTPGERADLPEFGCGLRALIFAGNSASLAAMTEMLVRDSLARWLADHLVVQKVEAEAKVDEGILLVRVEYLLVATRAAQSVELLVD
jgi:phage baseplate assembly protein W